MKSKITKFMAVLMTALLLFTVLPLTAIRSEAAVNYKWMKYSFKSGPNNSKLHRGVVVYPDVNKTCDVSVLLHGYTPLNLEDSSVYEKNLTGGAKDLVENLIDDMSGSIVNPTVVVIPYIPRGNDRMTNDDYKGYVRGNELSDLMTCILTGKFEKNTKNMHINKNKSIYLAGFSMGSFGVMDAADNYKNKTVKVDSYNYTGMIGKFGLLSPNYSYLDNNAERLLGAPWVNILQDNKGDLYYITAGKNEKQDGKDFTPHAREYGYELSRQKVLNRATLYCEYTYGTDNNGYYGDKHEKNLFSKEFIRFLCYAQGKYVPNQRITVFDEPVNPPSFKQINVYGKNGANCPYSDNVERFVWNLYINILQRNPNNIGKDEIDYHAYHLRYCGYTACDTIRVFLDSYEFQNLVYPKLSDEDFVESLYNGLLGRQSDSSGKAAWVKEHKNNPDRRSAYSMFKGFTDSQEFKNRFNNTGISAGVL